MYICSSGIHLSIFNISSLTNSVDGTQDAYCMIILFKVIIRDNDMLIHFIMRYDLCASNNSMQNGKSSILNGFPYEASKFTWDFIGDHICCLDVDFSFLGSSLSPSSLNYGSMNPIPKSARRGYIGVW